MEIQSSNSRIVSWPRRTAAIKVSRFLRRRSNGHAFSAFDAAFEVGKGGDSRSSGVDARTYLHSREKRILDVAGAVTLLLLLLPLFAVIAALIRATSRGPVIFKQKRCGADGTPFEIWKFRSMHIALDEADVVQATRTDPRVTSVGRFIRRSSIDELPQLFNVLQGHMSLIGPRPHALSHDAYFVERIASYSHRFGARPGMSGLAQVRGARGETPHVSDMERRIAFDLVYIRHASLGMDLRILLATVREMMFSSTAY